MIETYSTQLVEKLVVTDIVLVSSTHPFIAKLQKPKLATIDPDEISEAIFAILQLTVWKSFEF